MVPSTPNVTAHTASNLVAKGQIPQSWPKASQIVMGSPTPFLNGTLSQDDNLNLILALIGDRRVFIDEWSHGVGHGGTVIGLITEMGLAPLILQILFVVGLYVWSTLGHQRSATAPVQRKRSVSEQISALGHLYGHMLGPVELSNRLRAEVRHRIASAWRCPVGQVEERSSKSGTILGARAQRLLDRLARLPTVEPHCDSCGYNLRAVRSDACPECGHTVSPLVRRQIEASLVGDSRLTFSARDVRQVERLSLQLLDESYDFSREVLRERAK